MEDGLGGRHCVIHYHYKEQVLILVVVEDGLGGKYKRLCMLNSIVLILVVVEDGLREQNL